MATTGIRPARKKERWTARSLRAWWRQLPHWEKELRLLRYLLDRMPLISPVGQIIDTSDLPGEFLGEGVARVWPRAHRPYQDPAALHPYVNRRYVEPHSRRITRARIFVARGTDKRELPSYSPTLFSAEHFKTGGGFTRPYRTSKDVLVECKHLVEHHLADIRDPALGEPKSEYPVADLRSMKGISLPKALARRGVALSAKGVAVTRLYGILFYAGTALLDVLSFCQDLEHRRGDLRNSVRKEKRSLRSHLAYWRNRLRPDTFTHLDAEVQEILHSLDVVRQPDDEGVKAYRRRLGIYRGGTKPGQHRFWTTLIGWAVTELKQAGCTEIEACEVVARLLHEMWPKIHPYNPAAVKSRYYRTL